MTAKSPGVNSKTSVFLVDDHPIVRRGLQLLLNLERDFCVCGEADTGQSALDKMLALKPDIAIVDLSLKSSSGLELIKQLAAMLPNLKILVFTMQAEGIYAERALRAGATGYVTKEEGTEKATEALRALKEGHTYFSPQVTGALMKRMTRGGTSPGDLVETLSDRELEVLEMLGQGLGSREISTKLNLSMKTIESHREHIKTKLGLKRASELTSLAFRWVHER